jgi:hypothetical protein
MSRGRFTGVVYGEFETAGGHGLAPLVAAAVAIGALVSWLATFLLELAVTAGALGAAILAACWLLTRRNGRDAELLAERTAALHAEVTAFKPAAEIHYHVHLAPGQTAEGTGWALPPGNAGN